MELNVLLQYLGQALGLPSLELNDHGVVSLRFGDQITVNLEPDPDHASCHLYSPLCRLPADAESRLILFEALLSANSFGRGTRGATFSMDEQHDEVLLGRIFDPAKTEPEDLTGWLWDMIEVMDIWQKRLPELSQDESSSSEVSPDEDFHHFLIKA